MVISIRASAPALHCAVGVKAPVRYLDPEQAIAPKILSPQLPKEPSASIDELLGDLSERTDATLA